MSRKVKIPLSEIEEHQVSTKISPSHTPNSAKEKESNKEVLFQQGLKNEWVKGMKCQ